MAAGTFTLFRANIDDIRMNDLTGAVVKMALLTSTAAPDYTNTGNSVWADLSANEIAAGAGYTAGGATVTTDVVTAVANGFKYSSDNVVWNASGGDIPAWRHAVMYVEGSLWGKTNPVIGGFIGDDTPADIPATLDGNPLTLTCPANGWFDITQA